MRELAKAAVRVAGTVLVLPRLGLFLCSSAALGRDRAFEGAMQGLARVPGIRGIYMRAAFLRWVIDACHPTATICYGVLMSKTGARLGANVYVGPQCSLGLVSIEADVLLADGVRIPSGAHTHNVQDLAQPIREQGGSLVMVRVGAGSWIGSGAVILADVGRNCVVGAGAVVTKPLPDGVVAAGVPAKVIRVRSC